MRIDLPQDLTERLQKRVAADVGATEVDVIRRALDSLDWRDEERRAIQEGISAWRAGDTQSFEEFDADFRAKNGIARA